MRNECNSKSDVPEILGLYSIYQMVAQCVIEWRSYVEMALPPGLWPSRPLLNHLLLARLSPLSKGPLFILICHFRRIKFLIYIRGSMCIDPDCFKKLLLLIIIVRRRRKKKVSNRSNAFLPHWLRRSSCSTHPRSPFDWLFFMTD